MFFNVNCKCSLVLKLFIFLLNQRFWQFITILLFYNLYELRKVVFSSGPNTKVHFVDSGRAFQMNTDTHRFHVFKSQQHSWFVLIYV